MTRIVDNERSWAINIISEINIFLRNNSLMIKRAGGETTVSSSSIRMFPDLLLYSDESMSQLLQGWELKMPDTPISDITFIKDATRKAKALGLDSFVVWNFNDCHLYTKQRDGSFTILKTWSSNLSHINNREKVSTYESDWKAVLFEVILDINEYYSTGTIKGNSLELVISENLYNAIILDYKEVTAQKLRNDSASNAVIESELRVWWDENKQEYLSDENSMYTAYAKVLLLNWINKFVFAHLIKRYHEPTRLVDSIDITKSAKEGVEIFEKITSECDFYNIFAPINLSENIPDETWAILVELNQFLLSNGLKSLNQDVLQSVLENTVLVSKREVSGQFTTPQDLADILVKVTMVNRKGMVIDPCCGTGSIPKSALNEKLRFMSPQEAYRTTWASDKFSFPLQITNISLTTSSSMEIPSRIFQNNVFYLREGMSVSITDPTDGSLIEHNIPLYDTIVSNLPFVPFEILSHDDKLKIEEIKKDVKESTNITLSGKSDLYAYIIFSLWNNLKIGGRLGIIVSNSWLGSDWGKLFRDALLWYFDLNEVILSGNGRWFDNAKVVTTIIILTKRQKSTPSNSSEITFSLLKKSLSEFASDEEMKNRLANTVLLDRTIDEGIVIRRKYTLEEVYNLSKKQLSWNALFFGASWVSEMDDSLKCVSKFFKVFRGERRGWDKMFYPEDGHGIESKYLKRVLKSSRSIGGLVAETDSDAFCCPETIEELERLGHIGAVNWIKQFENGVNNVGKPLVETLKRANMHWYEMRDDAAADLVTGMNPDKRLFVARFEEPSFINQRLIGFKTKNASVDVELCHALLNSMVGMYFIEALGFGRGLGALDINNKNLHKMMMLNPDKVSRASRDEILKKFQPLLEREILSTEEELTKEDRKEFDMAILRAFGLEDKYSEIKESLLTMQKSRLSVR
ncbi:N-6 DNA methylase [Tissierella sp.]|uniref:N-6 DNA methylase n=1 Tax=Tissierella sp. TaxID=41274 RepID=UPI0030633815